MTREEKALLYEDLVRDGDRVNREISKLKSNINLTPEQETQLKNYNEQLAKLEARMNQLLANG